METGEDDDTKHVLFHITRRSAPRVRKAAIKVEPSMPVSVRKKSTPAAVTSHLTVVSPDAAAPGGGRVQCVDFIHDHRSIGAITYGGPSWTGVALESSAGDFASAAPRRSCFSGRRSGRDSWLPYAVYNRCRCEDDWGDYTSCDCEGLHAR